MMVDGSWQTHDEFVEDVMENIDDQELSEDSDRINLIWLIQIQYNSLRC